VSAARDAILAAVREATAGGSAPERVERVYRRHGELSTEARVDLFCERVGDYRATVRRVAPARLREALGELAPGRIGVPPELANGWRPAGAVEDHGLTPRELDALDGVVTGCTVAIAETGTLVLSGGRDEGRRALTLVPDLHVCIVHAGQIVETVPEALDALSALAERPLTFVSGPSATSDIELKRVEGVHGPRRLVVLVVDEGGEDA
jgi:L-lactate dehydrogenase complex protein LldG